MDLRRRKRSLSEKMPLYYCVSICFFLSLVLISTVNTRTPCFELKNASGRKSDCYFKELLKVTDKRKTDEIPGLGKRQGFPLSLRRRYLSGAGSSPPRCTAKCGKCTPCKPVHVPVPPGTPVTSEYYPEAWRCKCGNKLYMP